jgi:hypothetical protein
MNIFCIKTYFVVAESLTAGIATGLETGAAAESETTTSGSGNMVLLSVEASFFEQLVKTNVPINAIKSTFFIFF